MRILTEDFSDVALPSEGTDDHDDNHNNDDSDDNNDNDDHDSPDDHDDKLGSLKSRQIFYSVSDVSAVPEA